MKKFQLILLGLLLLASQNIYPETFTLAGNGNPLFSEASGAAETAESFLVNPANISQRQIEFQYYRLWGGLTDGSNLGINQFCAVWPFSRFGLGLGYQGFNLAALYLEEKITLAINWRIYQKIYLGISGINRRIVYQESSHQEYVRQDPVFDYGKNSTINNSKLQDAGLYAVFGHLAFSYSFGPITPTEKGLSTDYNEPAGSAVGAAFFSPDFWLSAGYRQLDIDGYDRYSIAMKKIFSVTKNLTVNFGLGLNYGPGTAQQIILNGGGKINNFRLNYYWKYPVGSLSTSGHQIFSVGMDFGQPATPISLRQPALPTTTIPAVPQPVSLTVIPGIAAYLVTISSPAVSEVFTTTITAPTPLPTTITEVSSGTIPTSVFSSTAPAPALKKPKPRELPLIRTHPVAAGETLPEIAERYYGNKNDWPKIYQANEDKIEKGLLVPGTVLIIP